MKTICVKLNLHPEHPDVMKEIIKIIGDGQLAFFESDLKELKQGKIYRYYDNLFHKWYYSRP